MEKIAVIYFSGTGNTEFVAKNIKNKLQEYGYNCDLVNIEKNKINTNDYKSLIIGGPVYVDRYPEILFEYMERYLQNYSGKCMLFTTQASFKDSTAFQHCINRIPSLNITYCTFVTMPNNFYNFMFKKSSKEEENQLMKKSYIVIEESIRSFLENKVKIYSRKKLTVKIIDKTYKVIFNYYVNFENKKITIDKDKCNKCKLCEKLCPVGSIKISDNVSFSDGCLFCQRCINNCPNNAFLLKNKKIVQYKPNFKNILITMQ
ncbi:EFR1 family ferrodoxin [Terrisporobacter sp.]